MQILFFILLIIVVAMAIYLSFVISDAAKGYRDDCDYLMVLGGLVIGADTPSDHLVERMDYAVGYLKESLNCFVVPCGGCFRQEQKLSEAQIIADYLVEKGIDPKRIVLEDKSTTTVENFKFGIKVIEKHSDKNINHLKVAFLSSDFHMHRAALIAKGCGIEKPLRVSCPTHKNIFRHYIREFIVAFELLNPNTFK